MGQVMPIKPVYKNSFVFKLSEWSELFFTVKVLQIFGEGMRNKNILRVEMSANMLQIKHIDRSDGIQKKFK